MAQRNKLIRKTYARLYRSFFWQAMAQMLRSNRFASAFITGGLKNKAEQHIGVHEDYGGNHF